MGHPGDVAALLGRSATLVALSDLHALLASAAKQGPASSATQPRRRAPQASPAGIDSQGAQEKLEPDGSTGSGSFPRQAAAGTPSDTAKQRPHSQGESSSAVAAQEPSRDLSRPAAHNADRRLVKGQRSGGPGRAAMYHDKAGRAAANKASRILMHAERKAWFMLVGGWGLV